MPTFGPGTLRVGGVVIGEVTGGTIELPPADETPFPTLIEVPIRLEMSDERWSKLRLEWAKLQVANVRLAGPPGGA